MVSDKKVNVIGAGLSGCEAAWQLAQRGVKVDLYEGKTIVKNEIQKMDYFAELVCSNSLRSTQLTNAVGVMKKEMIMFDSIIMKAAFANQVPAGGALAVDRVGFSKTITKMILDHPNITVHQKIYDNLNDEDINIVASGPLTATPLQKNISSLVGSDHFYFYDAVAPIIAKDSIDFNVAYYKSRYCDEDKDQDYINCPMDKEQFLAFSEALVNAKRAPLHDFEKEHVFEGCMPVEILAKRNVEALRFGPLKPKGLNRDGYAPNYAVVQLRQDDAIATMYNIVGFQTNLTWPEQDSIVHLIPGLKNAKIIRYGVMHKNNYLNAPLLLNPTMQLKAKENCFFVGQISGIEGYLEASASGLVGAINVYRLLNNQPLLAFPRNTIIGSLLYYITNASSTNFQPMKSNFGLLEPFAQRFANKQEKYLAYAERAVQEMEDFIANNDLLAKEAFFKI